MNIRLQASLCALFGALASPFAAAQSNPDFAHELDIALETATYRAPGTITRSVAGDVTGDLRPDVFARGGPNGASILFLYAPFQGAATAMLTQTANDFDIATGAGSNGRDALAFVSSSGLKLLT